MRLVLATRNAHKVARARRAAARRTTIEPLADDVELPPETGDDLRRERARQGARRGRRDRRAPRSPTTRGSRSRRSAARPGVRSARYAGEDATDEENLRAAAARARPTGSALRVRLRDRLVDPARPRGDVFEGRCEGTLTTEPRGTAASATTRPSSPTTTTADRTMAELSPRRRTRSATAAARPGRCWHGWRRADAPRRRGAAEPDGAAAARRRCSRSRRRSSCVALKLVTGLAHRLARDDRRGGALGDRPGRRAADVLRAARGAQAGRSRAPLRPRQGRAPGGARRGRVPARRQRRDRVRVDQPARRAAARPTSTRRGGRSPSWASCSSWTSRARSSRSRASRRYASAALAANALHFASDFAGTLAVVVGLALVRAGYAVRRRLGRALRRRRS